MGLCVRVGIYSGAFVRARVLDVRECVYIPLVRKCVYVCVCGAQRVQPGLLYLSVRTCACTALGVCGPSIVFFVRECVYVCVYGVRHVQPERCTFVRVCVFVCVHGGRYMQPECCTYCP